MTMSETKAAHAKQSNEDRKMAARAKERCKDRKLFLLEVIVMTPIVLITIVAFLIPSILYALPPPDSASSDFNSSKGDVMKNEMADNGFDNATGLISLVPMCSRGFFLDDEDSNGRNATNTCKPACGEFLQKPLAQQFFENLGVCGSLIAGVLMFLMATTVQRKTLLVFPAIINVYIAMSTFSFGGILFIGILDNFGLYCGQRDLLFLQEKGNETPFTSFVGMAFIYFVVQFDVLGTMQAFFLLWSVKYPVNFRYMKRTGKMRYAHITGVLLVVFGPLLGPFLLLVDGYLISVTDSPYLAAFGRNRDHFFIAFTLPATISLAATTILLDFMFWTILQVFVLKKLLFKEQIRADGIGKAELKITINIIFYTLNGVTGQAATTYLNQNIGYQNSIVAYITCESSGLISNCLQVLDVTTMDVVRVLLSSAFVSLLLWPVAIIFLTIHPKLYLAKLRSCRKTTTASSANASSSNTVSSTRNAFALPSSSSSAL